MEVECEGIEEVWLVVVRVGGVWRNGIWSVAIGNGGSGDCEGDRQTKPLHCSGYLLVL